MGEWINKSWCNHTMESYAEIKLLIHATWTRIKNNYAERKKKPKIKEYILYGSIYIKF